LAAPTVIEPWSSMMRLGDVIPACSAASAVIGLKVEPVG
jgi:hypothetical protein